MKRVEGSDKRKAFARRQRNQLLDNVKAGNARNQFAMRIVWLILGAVCAALGCVLLRILLK